MTAAGPVLLGVDVGNTNVKCVALGVEAGVLHVVRLPTAPARRAAVPGGPDAALDVEALWRIVCATIRAVLAGLAASRPDARLAGIAVASTGCEVVLVDGAGHQVPAPARAPEDGRAFRELAEAIGPDRFSRTTGYPLEPGYAPFRLAAMRETAPADFARVDGVLSVSGYVTHRLTGVRAFEPSLVGSLAVRDVAGGRFWSGLLEDIGVQPGWFGTELESGDFVGEVQGRAATESGLPAGLPVFAGAHDYLAAALAVQEWSRGAVLDVLGTWEIIATFHDAPRPDLRRDGMRAFVDTHVIPGRYSFMIEALVGGRMEWFRSVLGASTRPPGSAGDAGARPLDGDPPGDGPLYLPGPLPGPGVGSILGIGPHHSRADLLRSVLTGLVLLTVEPFRAQLAAVGAADPIVCAVGGGSADRSWMQLKADTYGVAVVVPAVPEATACGAALLAGLGGGVLPDPAAASAVLAGSPVTTYEPDPARHERLLELHESRFRPLQLALSAASGHPAPHA